MSLPLRMCLAAVSRGSALLAERRLWGPRASVISVRHSCSSARGILPDRGLNLRLLYWQSDSLPLDHREAQQCLLEVTFKDTVVIFLFKDAHILKTCSRAEIASWGELLPGNSSPGASLSSLRWAPGGCLLLGVWPPVSPGGRPPAEAAMEPSREAVIAPWCCLG